jgi:hypothetical protein
MSGLNRVALADVNIVVGIVKNTLALFGRDTAFDHPVGTVGHGPGLGLQYQCIHGKTQLLHLAGLTRQCFQGAREQRSFLHAVGSTQAAHAPNKQ